MKYLMKIRMPTESANENLSDPEFGKKMQEILAEVKAEAAYFGTVDGSRGGYVVVNMDNASEMPAKAEPFFIWLDAEIDLFPVMTLEDLGKAGPSIAAAFKKWG
jgi:hypothetical protein